MPNMNINPTRMELKRLKERLKTAVRGHKLLKDKVDEMIRQFIVIIKENRRLRLEVESDIANALAGFMMAKSITSSQVLEEAIMMPSHKVSLSCGTKSVMNVSVPSIKIDESENAELYPYSFLTVSSELDASIATLSEMLVKLIQLAELEKTCNMLANEIEKNKRRVSALEHIMIPDLQDGIKYIRMKLDENERGALTRLMKVKDMITEREEADLVKYQEKRAAEQ